MPSEITPIGSQRHVRVIVLGKTVIPQTTATPTQKRAALYHTHLEHHHGIRDIYIPNDLKMQFVENRRYGIQAVVPALNKAASSKAKTCYDKSFHVKAAQLWNLLPTETKDFASLDRFKISLSTFLKKFSDKPPVTGYSTANHNSLLDWSRARVEDCR